MSVIEHGPSIGNYRGRPIPGYIVTDDGVRWKFVGAAIEDRDGVALSQLARDECVIAPGLIYRRAA